MKRLLLWTVFLGIVVAAGAAVWQRGGLPALARAHHGPTAVGEAFTFEPARTVGQNAYFFRSVYLSDVEASGPPVQNPGRLLSLNPSDPQIPPRIYDTLNGTLLEVELSATDMGEAKIERVVALGPFSGDYAVARALVRRGAEVVELAGYVNRTGKWAIGPRYARAEVAVNQWGRVDESADGAPAARQIIDLENGRPVTLPVGLVPCNEPLRRLGHDALLCLAAGGKVEQASNEAQKPAPWLLAAGSGQLTQLPGAPAPGQWGDGAWILLADGRYVERGTGKLESPPEEATEGRELLPGVAALKRQAAYVVWDSAKGLFLAANLVAAEPLTRELFVACESGDARQLLVRHGTDYPYPVDAGSDLRCGLMDKEGQWRVKADYQHFYQLDGGKVVYRNAREWCVLTEKGEPVCGAQTPLVMLSGGLRVDAEGTFDYERRDGQYGYRDAAGAIRIPFQFEVASPFIGKVAAVQRLGTPGLMDTGGHWLTPPPPADLVASSAPCRNACWGLINRKGEWILPPIFEEAVPGPAPNQFWVKNEATRKFVLLDTRGAVLQQSDESRARLAGRGPFTLPELANNLVATAVNGRWGLADAGRKWILRPEFEAVTVVSGSRALVKSRALWGIVDAAGKWVMPPRYRSLQVLNENLLLGSTSEVEMEQGALIDADGTVLAIASLPRAAEEFDGAGMALAQVDQGNWGYLDRKGQWVVSPLFPAATRFNGRAALAMGDAPRSEPTPAMLQPYVVQSVWTWPSVNLLGAALAEKGPQGATVLRAGLMDGEGRWLVPKESYWSPVK